MQRDGRLRIVYSGRDLTGGASACAPRPQLQTESGRSAGRVSAAVPDTLVYRWNGTVILRLRETDDDGGHGLTSVQVSRHTEDQDVIDLANYLIDLVAKHKGVEAQF